MLKSLKWSVNFYLILINYFSLIRFTLFVTFYQLLLNASLEFHWRVADCWNFWQACESNCFHLHSASIQGKFLCWNRLINRCHMKQIEPIRTRINKKSLTGYQQVSWVSWALRVRSFAANRISTDSTSDSIFFLARQTIRFVGKSHPILEH